MRTGSLRISAYIGILILLCWQVSTVNAETSADDWFYLGISYYDEGNYSAAITAFLNEVATDSESAEVWNYLGLAYESEREYNKALSAFKRAVELNPQYSEAWNNQGNIYDLLDHSDDARLAYLMAQALRADDSNSNSNSNMQSTYDPGREGPSMGVNPEIPASEPRGPWVPGFSLITY